MSVQKLWKKVLTQKCEEKKLRAKLMKKIVNKSFEHNFQQICETVANKSCQQRLWTKVVNRSCN